MEDILPEEFEYVPGSALLLLNRLYYTKADGTHEAGDLVDDLSPYASLLPLLTYQVDPTITELSDGRTKLTWTFSGEEMRLFNCYSSTVTGNWASADLPFMGLGFTHLINFQTQWKSGHALTFGNYLNTAKVNHSYDFKSVSSGVADYADNSITSTAVVSLFGAAGTRSYKSVTNLQTGASAIGDNYASGGNVISADAAGDLVRYTLTVQNASQTNGGIRDLVVIDELPRAENDTGVVNRLDRGSGYSVLLGAQPKVTVTVAVGTGSPADVPTDRYRVQYGMSSNGLSARGDWTGSDAGTYIAWGNDSDGRNAIRIVFDSDYELPQDGIMNISFDAVVSGDAKAGLTAWNSFGYSYKTVTDYAIASRLYAEPLKVGVSIPDGVLAVTKATTGLAPDPADTFTFVLTQNQHPLSGVWYTLSGDTTVYTTDAAGQFILHPGQTALLHTGLGSGYQVREIGMPDGYTFLRAVPATASDGTVTGDVFSAGAFTGTLNRVDVTFTNEKSVILRDISVRKVWTGDADPNQPTSVTVQLYKNNVAYGNEQTLDAGNSWHCTWPGLPEDAIWSVRETSALPTGYTVQVTGSMIAGFVMTNNYTAPTYQSVAVTKVWAGDVDPNQPASIKVQLYKDGVPEGAEVELNALNSWKATWQNLAKDAVWTVRETTQLSSDYVTLVTGDAATGFVVTNTYHTPITQSVAVTKAWAGDADPNQPTAIKVQLCKDGVAYGAEQTLNAAGNWRYTWTGLPADSVWTVRETSQLSSNYEVAVTGSVAEGFVITNTYHAPEAKTSLTMKKISEETGKPLAHAVFILGREDAQGTSYYGGKDAQGQAIWDTRAHAMSLETDDGGHFTVSGLACGRYVLMETAAPSGYLLHDAPIPVVIRESDLDEGVSVTVKNKPVIVPPATGDASQLLWWPLLMLAALSCIVLIGRSSKGARIKR